MVQDVDSPDTEDEELEEVTLQNSGFKLDPGQLLVFDYEELRETLGAIAIHLTESGSLYYITPDPLCWRRVPLENELKANLTVIKK